MNCIRHLLLVFLLAPLTIAQLPAKAQEVRVSTRDELDRALRQAKEGTIILIAPGKYRAGLSQANLRGTSDKPIIIAGADPAIPPIIEGGGSGVHLSSPEHVELRDVVISGVSGNGLNIDDSGAKDRSAQHVLLRNIVVQDIGPTGNRDGIKLSGVNDFRIEGCRIQRWGSSGSAIDMVGCHDGVVTECNFTDATGDAANGVQAKGGSSEIIIQRCRFENAGGRGVNIGGSTGLAYIRPSNAEFEAQRITVEDCEIIGGMSAIAFVGVDGALVQHNTIYRPSRWAIRILQENTDARFVACRQGRFINNVVAFRSEDVREVINVGPNTAPKTFEFSGNAWCCLDRPAETQRLVRLPVQEANGIYGKDPGFADPSNGDLRVPNRKLGDAGRRHY